MTSWWLQPRPGTASNRRVEDPADLFAGLSAPPTLYSHHFSSPGKSGESPYTFCTSPPVFASSEYTHPPSVMKNTRPSQSAVTPCGFVYVTAGRTGSKGPVLGLRSGSV